jgi:hypothetical protein
MSKKLLLVLIAAFAIFGLASCGTELTEIVVSGIEDISVDNGVTYNVLDGVTATGNDGVDYTDEITLVTTSSAVNTSTGALDTLQAGVHFVRYEVRVEGIVAQYSRNITVKAPAAVEGELVVNGDMAAGIGGWNDPSVVYVADGASMTLSSDAGTLKAEVVAGSNFFTPRFGQMNIPFENGKTYEVSFDAKSSVAKEIALQVGELLAGPPYFTDFLPMAENILYRTITTEWATYSYKFTMTQENVKGGILFGLGTVKNNAVNATMYFDNIVIEESTPDPDTAGPIFFGVEAVLNLTTEDTFNPRAGVTAIDVGSGSMTHAIVVEIYNANNQRVSAIDMTKVGTYRIVYIVSDPFGNFSTAETLLTVSEPAALIYKDTGFVVDGTFTTTTTLPAEVQDSTNADITGTGFWYRYLADWGGAAATFNVVGGALEVDITANFGELWGVMVKQKGIQLINGETYRLSFTASASVNRNITVGFATGVTETFAITATPTTYTFDYTHEGNNVDTRIEFLLGQAAVGKVTLDNVKVEIGMDIEKIIYFNTNELVDGTFTTTTSLPAEVQDSTNADITGTGFWYRYLADWGGAVATFNVVGGALEVDITTNFGELWGVMVKQKGISLENNTLYRLTFTASASVNRNITVGFATGVTQTFALTSTPTTYTFEYVHTGADVDTRIEFLLGQAAAGKVTLDNVEIHQGIYPALETFTNTGFLVDGTFTTTTSLPAEVQDSTNADITGTGFWYRYLADWGGAVATFNVVGGALEVDITTNFGELWGVMVKQKGISLENNTLYRLTFTASASVDRNITVGFATGATKTFALTSTPTTYTYDFYYTGADVDTRIEFLLGQAAAGKVTLDNVELYSVVSETSVTATYTGTTTNMVIDTNNASLIGLDPALFNVVTTKGEASVEVGLNASGQIRIYANRQSGNGNTLTISIAQGYIITGIELEFGASTNSPTATLTLGSQENALVAADLLNKSHVFSDLNISSFSIKNTQNSGTSNAQIFILSIIITYTTNTSS